MQYAFQAWNTNIPGEWRDLLFGIGSEEFGHVEMLAIMIAQLLEKDPNADMQATVDSDPVTTAVIAEPTCSTPSSPAPAGRRQQGQPLAGQLHHR